MQWLHRAFCKGAYIGAVIVCFAFQLSLLVVNTPNCNRHPGNKFTAVLSFVRLLLQKWHCRLNGNIYIMGFQRKVPVYP